MSQGSVTTLTRAEPPAKQSQLRMLDLLRDEVERGEVICLFALTIRAERQFDVTTAGDIDMSTLAGMLGRAQLDALEAMR